MWYWIIETITKRVIALSFFCENVSTDNYYNSWNIRIRYVIIYCNTIDYFTDYIENLHNFFYNKNTATVLQMINE